MFKLLFLNSLSTSRRDRTLSSTHRTLSPTHRTLSPKNRLFLLVKNDRKEEGFSILEVLVTILVITGFILGSLQATLLATFMRVQAQDKQEAANWVQQDLELIRYEAFTYTEGACGSYGSNLANEIKAKGYNTNQIVRIQDRTYQVSRQYLINPSSPNILPITYRVRYAQGNGTQPAHPRYKSGGDNVVTSLSTEVLPNAALDCGS